ncbi:MAG: hypothetical protein AAFO96_07270 [Bacteroidota bacterium]
MRFSNIIITLLLFVSLSAQAIFAQNNCNTNSILSFTDYALEGGNWGELYSVYRFTDVFPGADAMVSIVAKKDARLVDLDLTTTGHENSFQPVVKLTRQHKDGNRGHMDFRIEFVISGSTIPMSVGNWIATALDVDGDGYRLRESVAFAGGKGFTVENTTALLTEDTNLAGRTGNSFICQSTKNVPGIGTSATQHMVSMEFENENTFFYRAAIKDNGKKKNTSRASERMFSLNFSPCLTNSYTAPQFIPTLVFLPVEWADFEARPYNGGVTLNWATTRETNNQTFIVQRSRDGIYYESVGTLEAAGNSETTTNYTYTDRFFETGDFFYRIMQVDVAGMESYSTVEQIQLTGEGSLALTAHAQDHQLHFEVFHGQQGHVHIIDRNGRMMYQNTLQEAFQITDLNTNDWSEGMYWIVVKNGQGEKIHKSFMKR